MAKRAAGEATCRQIRDGGAFDGKQGFTYQAGVSAETAGSTGICLHRLTIPPGKRGRAHRHDSHETAIYQVSGQIETWYGPSLEHHVVSRPGDFLYIPPGCPHLPANMTDQPAVCLIARTDASEQESVVLLPELDDLVPELNRRGDAPRHAA